MLSIAQPTEILPAVPLGDRLADADHARTPAGRASRATTTVRQAEAANEITEIVLSSGNPAAAAAQVLALVGGAR